MEPTIDWRDHAPHLAALQAQLPAGTRWPTLERAIAQAAAKRAAIATALADLSVSGTDDASIVVFGSLARGEWTQGSDVDWTLLVDGPADPAHGRAVGAIRRRLEERGFVKPGRSGTFGQMTFSHDLVHCIGGTTDSNLNMTRRMLLLLESRAIGRPGARARTVSAVLDRYLDVELRFERTMPTPRFLQNDIVRYWRTIAVDYASKQWDRNNAGWAVRNAKLRVSRKLLFAAGMLMCFEFDLEPPSDQYEAALWRNRLVASADEAPLELLARILTRYAPPEVSTAIIGAYDEFLALLDDPARRRHLARLAIADADGDALFDEVRRIGRAFQAGLSALFWETEPLPELTKRYGFF